MNINITKRKIIFVVLEVLELPPVAPQEHKEMGPWGVPHRTA